MNNIKTKKLNRFNFLNKLYEITNGNRDLFISSMQVGKEIGICNPDDVEQIVDYLNQEGFIEAPTLGGDDIRISHYGSQKIEKKSVNLGESIDHFPAQINITNIHQMANSQIQQGTHSSTQTQDSDNLSVDALQSLLKMFSDELKKNNIPIERHNDVEAEIATIKAQLQSTKPKTNIIKESLMSLKTLFTSVGSSVVTSAIQAYLVAHNILPK